MPLLLMKLIFSRIPSRLPFFFKPVGRAIVKGANSTLLDPQIGSHFMFLESELARREWFAGPDFTAGQNDAHDSGFADQLAIAVAIQCGIHQSGLDLVELGARVAQSGDLDDGVPAEMQASAGRQPEQIDAGCRHVFAHLAGG